jgi:hypothetical protein
VWGRKGERLGEEVQVKDKYHGEAEITCEGGLGEDTCQHEFKRRPD